MRKMQHFKNGKFFPLLMVFLCLVSCTSSPKIKKELQLGEEALLQERYEEAITHLTAHLAKFPQDADARLKLGLALLKNERLDEAVKQFKEVLKFDPENIQSVQNMKQSIFDQAERFFSAGKYDVAIRHLLGYVTINPDDPDTHIKLTRYFLAMGDVRHAMGSMKKAASLDPKNPEVVELLDYFSAGFH